MTEPHPHLRAFAARLRGIQGELQVPNGELAEALQVSRPQISAWRSGTAEPSALTIRRMEVYFGLDAGALSGLIDVGDMPVAANAGMYAAREAVQRRGEIDAIIDEAEDDR